MKIRKLPFSIVPLFILYLPIEIRKLIQFSILHSKFWSENRKTVCTRTDINKTLKPKKSETKCTQMVKEVPLFFKGKLLASSDYYTVTDKYYRLERDCTKPEDFGKLLKVVDDHLVEIESQNYPEMKVLLMASKAGMYYTHNEQEKCIETITNACGLYHQIQTSSKYSLFLYLRISACFSLWAMKEKKFGIASEWIGKSNEIMSLVESSDETARIWYVKAKYLSRFILTRPNDELKYQIIKYLDISRSHLLEEYAKSKGSHTKVRTHVPFRTSGIIRTRLDYPDTDIGRKRGVKYISLNDMDNATQDLARLRSEAKYSSTSQSRARVHIFESCYYLRWAQMYETKALNQDTEKARDNMNKAWFYINQALDEISGTKYQQVKDARDIKNFIEAYHLFKNPEICGEYNVQDPPSDGGIRTAQITLSTQECQILRLDPMKQQITDSRITEVAEDGVTDSDQHSSLSDLDAVSTNILPSDSN